MTSLLILVAVTLSTVLGDWCIKIASTHPSGLTGLHFLMGALFYGLPAVGWFFLMRTHSLAAIAVFYSSATVILLAVLGVAVFREAFGLREALGVTLAVAAVVVVGTGQ